MSRRKHCTIDVRNGFHAVVMGDMEIWDGADLARLRETLSRLVDLEDQKAIGVDLTYVKYIPSGFFGMLYDYTDRGVAVRLYSPHDHVQKMLWFREFFESRGDAAFELSRKSRPAMSEPVMTRAPWAAEFDSPPQIPVVLPAPGMAAR